MPINNFLIIKLMTKIMKKTITKFNNKKLVKIKINKYSKYIKKMIVMINRKLIANMIKVTKASRRRTKILKIMKKMKTKK